MPRALVKNWASFQHYKDRRPPWIKLHHSILEDYAFGCLPLASKALAPCIWLLASESEDGSFDADPAVLAFRLHWSIKDIAAGLSPLFANGFIANASKGASKPRAKRKQPATPETETETETETENAREARWSRFRDAYPRHTAMTTARKRFDKLDPDDAMLDTMLAAIKRQSASPQWTKDNGEFIPHAATWLNQRRWEDEAPKAGRAVGFDPAATAMGAVL